MKVEIVEIQEVRSYVGIRATEDFAKLGQGIRRAFQELNKRTHEIGNIHNANVTYGISPPNYKGNKGLVDYYCCYEVKPIANVPHGMVLIHILPRMYTKTHYTGPLAKLGTAYDFTSKWMNNNDYAYDDVEYYFEIYDEQTIYADPNDERSEISIFCPAKKIAGRHQANQTSGD